MDDPGYEPGQAAASPNASEENLQENKDVEQDARTICRHFLQGRCKFGARCRYSHVLQQPQDDKQANEQEQTPAEQRDVSRIGNVVRHLPVFEQPTYCYGLAMTGGRLCVSSNNYHVVDVVDTASGGQATRWGTFNQQDRATIGQPAQFNSPWGVAVDEQRGRVYVSSYMNDCVVVVRQCDGIVEAVWRRSQEFKHPRGLAYCPASDLLYVADSYNHCVKVLRASDGQCVQVLGTGKGSESHQMYYPSGVAVDSHQIYIADYSNHRVLVYAKQSGTFLFQIGQGQGSGNSQFNCPWGVSVDSEAGVVYVADTGNHRVGVYRSCDGSYVRQFQVVQADNTKAQPIGVMWDAAAGVLYVTTYGSVICVYDC